MVSKTIYKYRPDLSKGVLQFESMLLNNHDTNNRNCNLRKNLNHALFYLKAISLMRTASIVLMMRGLQKKKSLLLISLIEMELRIKSIDGLHHGELKDKWHIQLTGVRLEVMKKSLSNV